MGCDAGTASVGLDNRNLLDKEGKYGTRLTLTRASISKYSTMKIIDLFSTFVVNSSRPTPTQASMSKHSTNSQIYMFLGF